MPAAQSTPFSLHRKPSGKICGGKKKWLQIICIFCLELDGPFGWLRREPPINFKVPGTQQLLLRHLSSASVFCIRIQRLRKLTVLCISCIKSWLHYAKKTFFFSDAGRLEGVLYKKSNSVSHLTDLAI